MVEIDTKGEIHRMKLISERPHIARKCSVAVPVFRFRAGNSPVDSDRLIVGEEPDELQNVADGFARLVAGEYEVGDDDGASIMNGLRNSMLVLELDNRIERCTRRLAPGTRQLSSYRRVNSCSVSFEVCHVRHYSASHRDIVKSRHNTRRSDDCKQWIPLG